MKSFEFEIPTKVYFGREEFRDNLLKCDLLSNKKILVVTSGRSLYKYGYIDELTKTLGKLGEVAVFDHVSANPKLTEIEEGGKIWQGNRSGSDSCFWWGQLNRRCKSYFSWD